LIAAALATQAAAACQRFQASLLAATIATVLHLAFGCVTTILQGINSTFSLGNLVHGASCFKLVNLF